ncbi:Uncharacterised protein [uncultured archaeon]|nr:Uncharacterised protein [uncultured archaeon]
MLTYAVEVSSVQNGLSAKLLGRVLNSGTDKYNVTPRTARPLMLPNGAYSFVDARHGLNDLEVAVVNQKALDLFYGSSPDRAARQFSSFKTAD